MHKVCKLFLNLCENFTVLFKKISIMLKIITNSFFMLFFIGQLSAQPDFRKAVKISPNDTLGKRFEMDDSKAFRLLNACQVGNYKVSIYLMRNDSLYHVMDTDVLCFNNWSSDVMVMPKDKVQLYSSSLPRLTEGHWFIDIPNVQCGFTFEFIVDNQGEVSARKYEFGCK